MAKQAPTKLNTDLSSDVQEKKHDPWLEPIPPEVEARWNKDIAETEEEEKKTGKPRKTYHNADEFIKGLEKTINN